MVYTGLRELLAALEQHGELVLINAFASKRRRETALGLA
jgi:hypothetical protein